MQFKKFHREIITELEKKTEMDVKYMNVSVTITKFSVDVNKAALEAEISSKDWF